MKKELFVDILILMTLACILVGVGLKINFIVAGYAGAFISFYAMFRLKS